jgi:hypothetical protein
VKDKVRVLEGDQDTVFAAHCTPIRGRPYVVENCTFANNETTTACPAPANWHRPVAAR